MHDRTCKVRTINDDIKSRPERQTARMSSIKDGLDQYGTQRSAQ